MCQTMLKLDDHMVKKKSNEVKELVVDRVA